MRYRFGIANLTSLASGEADCDVRQHMQHDSVPTSYEQKFSEFHFLIRTTREEVVLIHHPEVLGDTYEELVESLNQIADAQKRLVIVPRRERDL